MRLIDADEMATNESEAYMSAQTKIDSPITLGLNSVVHRKIQQLIADTPTVDAVPLEEYEELREEFVDFVCSGIHNPAPYCKNRCQECVDSRGFCTYRRCTGFDPDGRWKEGAEND